MDHRFSTGERFVFLREMFDRDMGCDVWVFGTEESRRIEDSLPDGGMVDGRYLWHELVHHSIVYGRGDYANPSAWMCNFEVEPSN
ncbi:MAG: hypothetical protein ACXWIU_04675 [Limisphaerales bacterium]